MIWRRLISSAHSGGRTGNCPDEIRFHFPPFSLFFPAKKKRRWRFLALFFFPLRFTGSDKNVANQMIAPLLHTHTHTGRIKSNPPGGNVKYRYLATITRLMNCRIKVAVKPNGSPVAAFKWLNTSNGNKILRLNLIKTSIKCPFYWHKTGLVSEFKWIKTWPLPSFLNVVVVCPMSWKLFLEENRCQILGCGFQVDDRWASTVWRFLRNQMVAVTSSRVSLLFFF